MGITRQQKATWPTRGRRNWSAGRTRDQVSVVVAFDSNYHCYIASAAWHRGEGADRWVLASEGWFE